MIKGLKVIGVVMLIIIVLFIGFWIWADGLKEDMAVTQEKIDKIKSAYPLFSEKVNSFSEKRNEFYQYKEDLYLETLRDNADAWNNFMSEYASSIQEVEDAAKDLKDNCNIEYGDVSASTKCDAFKVNYEAAQNYYISDINLYNDMVGEYNKYNIDGNYPVVNEGVYQVYQDYIDYDEDGEFFGKEVSIDE